LNSIQEFHFYHPNSNWKTTQNKKAKISSTKDGTVTLPNQPSPKERKWLVASKVSLEKRENGSEEVRIPSLPIKSKTYGD
jgi:hypothetical protein